MPGYVDQSIYQLHDDLAKAKALAESQGVTPATPVPVVLYTSNGGAAPYRAQIIQTELAQIGLNVTIVEMPRNAQIERTATLWRTIRHHDGRLDRRLQRDEAGAVDGASVSHVVCAGGFGCLGDDGGAAGFEGDVCTSPWSSLRFRVTVAVTR